MKREAATLQGQSPLFPHFAEATGRLAKTDRIDAAMLARYGALLEARILQAEAQIHNDLKELHVARLALIKDRTAAKNRARNLSSPLLKKHNADRLRQIDRQIKALDEAIMSVIGEDATLKAKFEFSSLSPAYLRSWPSLSS